MNWHNKIPFFTPVCMAKRICLLLEYSKASSDVVKVLMTMLMKPLFMPNKQRERETLPLCESGRKGDRRRWKQSTWAEAFFWFNGVQKMGH